MEVVLLWALTQIFMYMLNIAIPSILNVILLLIITLVIASLTLMERKILSLMQRRVGPYFVGYKGRLQYIADALKLFIKGTLIPEESNKFWFVTIPSIILAVCYTFWVNSVWSPSLSIFEIEYNLVYASLLSIIFSFCVILTGYFSKNKYSVLASVRACLLVANIEIFLGLMFLNLIIISESFNFSAFVLIQEISWLIFTFSLMSGLIVISFLLEINRAPFDLAEAESELVSGYTTEMSGFLFGLYYLGEYFHLFFFSMTVSLLFLGGWEKPTFFILAI
jgi:NADH-quinone oxidoreductase subunit H